MNPERYQLMVQVARLHYTHQKSQQDIAKQLGLSRPTISRLIADAIKHKIVTFTIHDDQSDLLDLENDIQEKYGLKAVKVANVVNENYEYVLNALGQTAAQYIEALVKAGDILGVSWGRTIYHVSKHLSQTHLEDIQVVQLKGGVSQSQRKTYSYETIDRFAHAFNTEPVLLNLPVIFENQHIKDTILSDSHIARVLNLAQKANIAVFTVGSVRPNALLFQLNYLTEAEITQLQTEGVGDICSRFYNAHGQIVNQELDQRTVGLSLNEIKNKDHAILVAGGQHKLAAIKGALSSGFCNELITDKYTAKQLLAES